MFFDTPALSNALVCVLPLIPILAYPECPDYCEHCHKEIKGSSFFKFSTKLYCDSCRPFLSQEELEREQNKAQSMKKLLVSVLDIMGVHQATEDNVEEIASGMFLSAIMKRKREQIKYL